MFPYTRLYFARTTSWTDRVMTQVKASVSRTFTPNSGQRKNGKIHKKILFK